MKSKKILPKFARGMWNGFRRKSKTEKQINIGGMRDGSTGGRKTKKSV